MPRRRNTPLASRVMEEEDFWEEEQSDFLSGKRQNVVTELDLNC